MKKIKVLQFSVAQSQGGRTQYILNNWKHIDKEKFQFDFVTFSPYLDFEQELVNQGCKVFHFSCYPKDNREKFIEEWDCILNNGYDIVQIATSYWDDTVLAERAKLRNVPKIIIHSHSAGIEGEKSGGKRNTAIEKHFCIRKKIDETIATDFWACSQVAAEWLYGEQIPKEKIKIMKNAIEVQQFLYNKEIREKARKELDVENKIVIGNVGRLVDVKNQDFLIRCFAQAFRNMDDVVLVVAGDGALRGELTKSAEELGVRRKVKFLGRREDINELYQAMDLFVLPSKFEGLSITLIEAQTAGLRCLCSDRIPKDAQITDLVQWLPLDATAWENALRNGMTYYERKNMAQEIADAGYDINKQIKVIENCYLT